jgi:hypothetical protein
MSKLPPLNLKPSQNLDSNISLNNNQRRRRRLTSQLDKLSNDQPGKTNQAYDEDQNDQQQKIEKRTRAKRSSQANLRVNDDQANNNAANTTNKKKKKRILMNNNYISNSNFLTGLEDDIIDMDDEDYEEDNNNNKTDSNRELITPSSKNQIEILNENDSTNTAVKSVPTDKFYLELSKKFTIQNKQMFEKKEQERLRMLNETRLKQKQKEELKYEISTPRIALYTHKILRAIFLFVQGINVGYHAWNVIVIYLINEQEFNYQIEMDQEIKKLPFVMFFLLFERLAMPIHCISYFLLAISIVDAMDR